MDSKYIQRKSVVKLPKTTGSISDTLNVEDKITNAPSINLVQQMTGIPQEGIIAYDGEEIPEGYEEVEAPSNGGADIATIVDLLYPIGRGFLDFTGTDYSNWLGLKWERELVGMFPVGYNPNDTSFNNMGKTGGEKTHTLTVNEMPSHTHTQNAHSHTQAAHNHGIPSYGSSNGSSSGISREDATSTITNNWAYSTTTQTPTINNTTATNQNTGGGQAHNNLPPYQVVSYWKRVDPNATKIINFTIDGTTYQAEEGMTWEEWCNSEYNVDNYECSSLTDTISPRAGLWVYKGLTACTGADIITPNYDYTVDGKT